MKEGIFVDYLTLALSTLLDDCDALTADVHIIAINAQTRTVNSAENETAHLLLNKLRELASY